MFTRQTAPVPRPILFVNVKRFLRVRQGLNQFSLRVAKLLEMIQGQASYTTMPCRPLLKWPGGKRSELRRIRPLIPPHRRYFEPFFGGGSVFFDAINVESYVNDLHKDLMLFYACVKEQRSDFFKILSGFVEEWESGTHISREAMYYQARNRYNSTDAMTANRAVDFFLIRQFAYGGMFRVSSSGNFNVPFGRAYARSDTGLRSKIEHLASPAVREKLKLLTLSTLDFEDFLNAIKPEMDDFVFLDPPYDTTFSSYVSDFDEEDQRRLARCLEGLQGKFMLVIKLTPLIEELYVGNCYSVRQYELGYKFNIKQRFSRSATHVMVTNYDANL